MMNNELVPRKLLKRKRAGEESNFVASYGDISSVLQDEFGMQENAWTRLEIGVEISGKNVPPLVQTFEEMRLPLEVLHKLKEKGFTSPTPIQMQAIPCVLSGRDVIGLAETGSGKTLSFLLPLLIRLHKEKTCSHVESPFCTERKSPLGLILVPTRELVEQVFHQLSQFVTRIHKKSFLFVEGENLNVTGICGGVSLHEQKQQLTNLRTQLDVLIATPGRLLHLIEDKSISLERVAYLVIDEVDRMLQEEMESQVRRLLQLCNPIGRQTLLWSATLPLFLQRLARSAVLNPIVVRMGLRSSSSQVTRNVTQRVLFVSHSNLKKQKLLQLLRCEIPTPPVLIFCNSHLSVDHLTGFLHAEQFHVASFHGEKSQNYRFQVVKALQEGYVDILVATDLASRGLDFALVDHVVLYDMPPTIEDFIHRSGRTGRAGRKGTAFSFLTYDCVIAKELKQLLIETKQSIPHELNNLQRFAS